MAVAWLRRYHRPPSRSAVAVALLTDKPSRWSISADATLAQLKVAHHVRHVARQVLIEEHQCSFVGTILEISLILPPSQHREQNQDQQGNTFIHAMIAHRIVSSTFRWEG